VLKRLKFGVAREHFSGDQRSLIEDTIDADIEAVQAELASLNPKPAAPDKQVAKRRPLPANLPRREFPHEPGSTVCGCGCQMIRIGEDVAEKLDYQPGVFSVLHRQKVPSGSATAKAIDYSLGRWAALTRHLDDGTLTADNNWAENRIRPIALGRNNWLFAGSLRAGKRAEAVMSLISPLGSMDTIPGHTSRMCSNGCRRSLRIAPPSCSLTTGRRRLRMSPPFVCTKVQLWLDATLRNLRQRTA
jgi:hypothetical protein